MITNGNRSSGDCDPMFGEKATALIDRIRHQKDRPALDLSLCGISRVPLTDIYNHYGQVLDLDLSYNMIRFLSPKFPLQMWTVTKLDLSKNELKRLPDNFGYMVALVSLDIHENKLQTLPLSMGKLRNLEFLNMTKNPFRSPISIFLDHADLFQTRVPGCEDFARAVVLFLARLEQRAFASQSFIQLQNQQRREVTLESDNEEEPLKQDNGDDDLVEMESVKPEHESTEFAEKKEMSMFKTILLFVLPSVFTIALMPFLTAFFWNSAFLDHELENHPTLKLIWEAFRPSHMIAEAVIDSCVVFQYRPFYSPPPPPEAFLTGIFNRMYSLFSGITSINWW